MSALDSTPDKNQGTTDGPVDSPPAYEYSSEPGRDVWTHRETGLEVEIRKTAWPNQMRDPETATRDIGYRGWVYGDDHAEALSRSQLSQRQVMLDVAASFMAEFADGEYDVVEEPIDAHGPARWRRVADGGAR